VAVSGVWPAAISRKEETRVSFSVAVGGSPAMAAKSPREYYFFSFSCGLLVSRVRWDGVWDCGVGWVGEEWEVRKGRR